MTSRWTLPVIVDCCAKISFSEWWHWGKLFFYGKPTFFHPVQLFFSFLAVSYIYAPRLFCASYKSLELLLFFSHSVKVFNFRFYPMCFNPPPPIFKRTTFAFSENVPPMKLNNYFFKYSAYFTIQRWFFTRQIMDEAKTTTTLQEGQAAEEKKSKN
jgi:hypothetical protein